jgi:hypothetical protein
MPDILFGKIPFLFKESRRRISHSTPFILLKLIMAAFPVGARFSATVQTGHEAHPASYKMGTGSFPGVKRPGRGVDHPPHLAPILKKE